ncbi:MAG: hypothetical protein COT37_00885 [Parcubacteria group bacterium CG08_land_8_20_14_0_20_43_9]|nr:MAG: hypothetical protein COT37_00885 [Parcubacteria group bacterium CG08_land_8_20_14_0_20_43_9]
MCIPFLVWASVMFGIACAVLFMVHHGLNGPAGLFAAGALPWLFLPFRRGKRPSVLRAKMAVSICLCSAAIAWSLRIHHLTLEIWMLIAGAVCFLAGLSKRTFVSALSYMLWGIDSEAKF